MVRITLDKPYISIPVPEPDPTPISVKYGYLYPLFTFLIEKKATSSDGWRVPTRTEWEDISITAGGNSVAGGKLKSTRTSPTADPKWNTPNTGATDLYNLSFLPGGFRSDDGSGAYSGKNTMGIFWTSQVYDLPTLIYHMAALFNNSAALVIDVLGAYSGLSVRLLRDATTEELLLDDGTACEDYVSNDNHLYPTVKIGSYVMLAVNLAETKYRDGSDIPLIEDASSWGDIAVQSTGARCAYDNNEDNVLI